MIPLSSVPFPGLDRQAIILMTHGMAKFTIGEIVRHRLYPFRGVVIDVDPEFDNTDE